MFRARVCAGSDMLADTSFNVEMWTMNKAARCKRFSSLIVQARRRWAQAALEEQ